MSHSTTDVLPVSIMVPTRNSMDKLPAHLARHRELFASCAEIVHCDSHSDDQTKAFFAQQFSLHRNLRQIDHPPGLYASWNHGLRHCTQPFTYISTVGDEISAEGLIRLVRLAQETESDVVFSPPVLVNEEQKVVNDILWPVHKLIANHRIHSEGSISSTLVFAEAVLHAPDGILGSAASCLFRTEFLRSRPYPTEYYGAGDSVWALDNLLEARCAIIPSPISTFLLHPKSYESNSALNTKIAILIRQFIRAKLQRLLEADAIESASQADDISRELIQQLHDYNEVRLSEARWQREVVSHRRQAPRSWYFSPRAWSARYRRNQLRQHASLLTTLVRRSRSASLSLLH
jgi:hypothetical protein